MGADSRQVSQEAGMKAGLSKSDRARRNGYFFFFGLP